MSEVKRAMILAAGFGTRLGELGRASPKCLMTAGGKPLLQHVVDNLRCAGVSELVINLHHLGDKIEEYVGAQSNFGIQVAFSREANILGTGGGVKFAKSQLADSDHFIIHNADIFSELDIKKLVSAHLESRALATLAVMERPTKRFLLFTKSGEFAGWENPDERKQITLHDGSLRKVAFSGIQVVSSEIFEFMLPEDVFSIISVYVRAAEAGRKIMAYDMSGSAWFDIGTPERLRELDKYLKNGGKGGADHI